MLMTSLKQASKSVWVPSPLAKISL